MANSSQTVVRLSLRWILLVAVVMLLLGIAGGIIGVTISSPKTPLIPPRDQLVTNVQEVTISPNQAAQSSVANHERSLLLLAQGSRNNPVVFAAASVITNDGIIATLNPPVRDEVFAIDSSGAYVDLESVGQDVLYGITFYRARDGVFAPFSLATTDPAPGALLLQLSRSSETFAAQARQHTLEQYTLPTDEDVLGWLRTGLLTNAVPTLAGSPLLNDDGTVAALLIDSAGNRTIPVSYLRRSLERLSAGQREHNPFTTLGFTLRPTFAASTNQTGVEFQLVVNEVEADKTASALRIGDVVTAINEQELTWNANIADLVAAPLPITLSIERAGRPQTIILASPAPTP